MEKAIHLIILLVLLLSFSCKKDEEAIRSLQELEGGKIIAVPTGTVADQLVLQRFPDAKIVYFNTVLDCALAVRDGKADAAAYDKPILQNIASKNEGLTVLPELLVDDHYGFAVQLSNQTLKEAIDQTLTELKTDGRYEAMMQRWFPEKGAPGPMPDIDFGTAAEVLRFGTAAVTEPMSYVDENHLVSGFDIELASYVAQKMNRRLEVTDMEFGALLPALISGKVDMVGAGMSITEERAKRVLFSESYYTGGIAALVKSPSEKAPKAKASAFSSTNDIANKKIGVLLGSIHDRQAQHSFPKAQIYQYHTVSDLALALSSQKIDAAFFESTGLKVLMKTNNEIGVLADNLFIIPIGAGFNKASTELMEQFNTFLRKIKSDGTYDDMIDRWTQQDNIILPEIQSETVNGVLNVGLSTDLGLPNVAIHDGKLIGFDVEMAMRFAAFCKRSFVPVDMPFGSLIASISTGKIDVITSSMMITDERKEQINFSDPYFQAGTSIVVLKKNLAAAPTPTLKSVQDIANKRIGIFTGTVHDEFVARNYPKAKRFLYDFTSDMILSLKTDKIDVIMLDLITANLIIKHNPELAVLTDDIYNTPLGVGFRKDNTELRTEFNRFLKHLRESGVYEEMRQRWFVDDAEEAVMPQISNPESNKKLKVGVSVEDLPYVAFMNNDYTGFDIEMIRRFAEWAGYKLEIITIDFPALVPALAAGKVQMITDGISISEERAKQIDFSDPYAEFRTAVVAAKKNMAGFVADAQVKAKTPFFKAVANSFHNNIVREKRYLLILNGLKITIIISIFAALFGTLIGGLLCFMRMSKSKLSTTAARLFIDLIRGTPVLVFLMIIFYVVFASVHINPVIVAVIAFGINFGAYVSEMFRTSIESIDKGQREAGIASGFTKVQTFVHIIMPQALQRVLPVYKGEFISLVKMTSIVGYIAVQDLTKASDIIRSRTFDAFFPLIMAAVLYIIIAGLLTWALSYIEVSVDPKRKKIKRMKEVNA